MRAVAAAGLVLALVVAFFTGGALGAAPASAAEGQAKATSVAFENTTFENGSRQMLKVGWSVAAKADGDVSFRIDLPAELVGSAETIAMEGLDGSPIGECVVTATEVVCTVDTAYTKNNPFGIEGGLNLFVTANFAEGTEGDQTVHLNGEDLTVTIAEERPPYVCTENCDFHGQGFGKYGWYDNATDTITWEVSLPAPATGIAPGQDVTITDLADPAIMTLLKKDGNPRLEVARKLQRHDNNHQYPVWEAATEPVTLSNGDLTMSFVSEPGLGADFVADEGKIVGLDGALYRAVWTMSVVDEGKAGSYENRASYTIGSETDTTSNTAKRESQQNGSAWVIGKNFGMLQIAKQLSDDSSATIDAGFEYTIGYVATHDDGSSTSGEFVLRNGGSAYTPEIFKDTTITITEVTPTGGAAVTWEKPVFLGGDLKPLPTNAQGQIEIRLSAANGNLGTLTKILVVNEATLNTASFSAHKEITNDDGVVLPKDATFALEFSFPAGFGFPAGSGTLTLDQDGTVVSSDPVPLGAEVTFAEATPAAIDGAAWNTGATTITPATLTIDQDSATVDVAVSNTVERQFGSFTVSKALAGNGAAHLTEDDEFTVNWSYPGDAARGFSGDSGTLTVTAAAPATSPSIPVGAVVTLSEDAKGVSRTGTVHSSEFSNAEITIADESAVAVALTNTYELERGSIAVSKKIDGTGASMLAEDAGFTVLYSYPAGTGFEAGQGEIRVAADGSPSAIENLPYGATVTLTEATPDEVAGATWTGIRFAEGDADGETLEVTIGNTDTHEVTLTNTLTRDVGAFSIAKTVTGSGAGLVPAEQDFEFGYSYPAGDTFEAGSGTVSVPAGGTPVEVADIPVGAVVTLIEEQPAVVGGTWAAPVFTESNELVIEQDQTIAVGVVNEISLNDGQFQVTKQVTGSGAALVPADAEFLVDFSYPANATLGFAAGSGTLTVLADGTAVASEELPFGAEVTLSEQQPAQVSGAAWDSAVFTVDGAAEQQPVETAVLTIGDQTTATVALVNTIEKDIVPGGKKPSDQRAQGSKDGLAATGFTAAPFLIGGALALLLGAAIVVIARIRRRA